jgi:hypothetical protein
VQHRLQEHAKEVNELLLQKAYFYVCGDAANMAREVNTVLAKIMAEQRGIPETKAEEIVKSMRSANQYQVRRDCFYPFPLTILRQFLLIPVPWYRDGTSAIIIVKRILTFL